MKVEMSDGRGRVSKVIISLIHHLSLLSTNTTSSLTYSCQLSRHQASWLSRSWSIGVGSWGVSTIIITPSPEYSPSLLPCFPSVVGITAAAIESSIDPTDQWRHHHPTLLQSLFMLPTRSLHSIDGVSPMTSKIVINMIVIPSIHSQDSIYNQRPSSWDRLVFWPHWKTRNVQTSLFPIPSIPNSTRWVHIKNACKIREWAHHTNNKLRAVDTQYWIYVKEIS